MSKSYYSLGLMSGTSGDGVDTSIIQSDGDTQYKVIFDKYFKYTQDIYENIHNLKDKINNSKDLKNLSKEIEPLEKEITLFHAKAVNEIIKESKSNIDFIGFHGQTVYHNAKEKISKQLGDGKLLSQLTKKTVIYDFRQNDLKNDGQGAPLTPMFHKLLAYKYKFKIPLTFLNIGGITNLTHIDHLNNLWGWDVGPGNCLIDQWVRLNSKNKYDQDGKIARSGKINKIVLNSALESYSEINSSDDRPKSYDVKDFDCAVEEFQKVVDQYPNNELSKKSLFMIAYIYNNYLNAYSDAIITYNLFREKYPDDELIPSVKFELDGLKDIQSTIDSLNSIVNKKTNI